MRMKINRLRNSNVLRAPRLNDDEIAPLSKSCPETRVGKRVEEAEMPTLTSEYGGGGSMGLSN